MVRIGTVWDRTTDVLRGRGAMLGSIAAIGIFLPAVLNSAASLILPENTPSTAIIVMLLSFGVLVANVWGQLAMLAIATHPATDRADAARQGRRRLLPAIGVLMLLGLLFALALLPVMLMLGKAGMAMAQQGGVPRLPAGASGSISLYILALAAVILFVAARMILLNAVVLNERRGVGALARSWRLTRGMTFRLIALMLLFFIVMVVPTVAIQSIVGLIARLILGQDGIAGATFLAGTAGAVVTTVFTVIAAAFTAQLYVATVEEEGGALAE